VKKVIEEKKPSIFNLEIPWKRRKEIRTAFN